MRAVFVLCLLFSVFSCGRMNRFNLSPVPLDKTWQLVWEDDFTGSVIDPDHWIYDTGNWGWGNNELQNYTAQNSYLSNGFLILEARSTSDGRFTSARLKTKSRHSFLYGRIAARVRFPKGLGLQASFRTMGDNSDLIDWPACGEIVIAEMRGGSRRPDSLYASAVWSDAGGKLVEDGNQAGKESMPVQIIPKIHWQDYQIVEIIWNEKTITWLVNDKPYYQVDIGRNEQRELRQPQYLLLNLAVGGKLAGDPAKNQFPQPFIIDWVRVYQQVDGNQEK